MFGLLPSSLTRFLFNHFCDSASCVAFGSASRATWNIVRDADVHSAPLSFTYPILSRIKTAGYGKPNMLYVSLSALYAFREEWLISIEPVSAEIQHVFYVKQKPVSNITWTSLVNDVSCTVRIRDRMMPIRYAWSITAFDLLSHFGARHLFKNVLQINPLKLMQMWLTGNPEPGGLTEKSQQSFVHPWVLFTQKDQLKHEFQVYPCNPALTTDMINLLLTPNRFWRWAVQTFGEGNIRLHAPKATLSCENQFMGSFFLLHTIMRLRATTSPFLSALYFLTPTEYGESIVFSQGLPFY